MSVAQGCHVVLGDVLRLNALVNPALPQGLGIGAKDGGVEEQTVAHLVPVHGGKVVLGRGAGRIDGGDVRRGSNPDVRAHLVAHDHGLCLRHQHVVVGLPHAALVLVLVALEQHHHVLLIDGEEVLDLGAVLREADLAVLKEVVDALARGPAAVLVLQALRQVKVVQRHDRLDAVLVALVDDVVIVLDAQRVGLACPLRKDARPADGETELFEAHLGHEGDVFLEAMVVVDAVVEVGVALRNWGGVGYAQRAAILEIGALTLVRA